jgi:alpha-L-arabinofuranosidase
MKVACDEWNLRSSHHPGFPGGGGGKVNLIRERDENDRNETYTMADAPFSASFLHSCLRHAKYVQMAGMAPVVNVRGPLFVHPRGIVKRTTFHVMKMYATLLQPMVVQTKVAADTLEIGAKPRARAGWCYYPQ